MHTGHISQSRVEHGIIYIYIGGCGCVCGLAGDSQQPPLWHFLGGTNKGGMNWQMTCRGIETE